MSNTTEQTIIREEKKIEKELQSLNRRTLILALLVFFVLGGGIAAFTYLRVAGGQVYIEKSTIAAPVTDLAPHNPGVLQEVDVQVGDTVAANTVVARVGTEPIKTTSAGTVITVNNSIGKLFNPGEAVVSVIDPSQLHAVGEVQEDKGLADIRIGQTAVFTVDAFGSRKFYGVVDEISPTSHNSDVVFNISDQREEQDFEVKVRFDTSAYPELKNGMSAKIWIYKN